jgi:hypothetical protein
MWGRGEQHAQILNLMRAAWKLTTPEQGEKGLLGRDYESAALSLATANLTESPQSGVAKVPPSVFQLLHDIKSALDKHSMHCFLNREMYFSITEV